MNPNDFYIRNQVRNDPVLGLNAWNPFENTSVNWADLAGRISNALYPYPHYPYGQQSPLPYQVQGVQSQSAQLVNWLILAGVGYFAYRLIRAARTNELPGTASKPKKTT